MRHSEKGESFSNGFTLSQSTIPFSFVLLECAPVATGLQDRQKVIHLIFFPLFAAANRSFERRLGSAPTTLHQYVWPRSREKSTVERHKVSKM